MYRWYFSIAILTAFMGCGGGGNNASSPGPVPTPAPELCSRSTIEVEMDNYLQSAQSDTEFALYLERGEGQSYSFERGNVTLQTSLESASTSKLVAATAILWVVDSGVLSLDDNPQKWLPDWPLANDPTLARITLSHLLSFTSGLQDEAFCINLPNVDFFNCVNTIGENNAGNGVVPGADFHYSSSHLQVAGAMAVIAGGYASWTELFDAFKAGTGLFTSSQFDLPSLNNARLAGGMHWSGNEYAGFLKAYIEQQILSSSLSSVALEDHTASARFSLSPAEDGLAEDWHYGYGFWHECASDVFDCNAPETISSPGAYGAYPFINYNKDFFGILARQGNLGTFVEGLTFYRSIQPLAEAWADCGNP